MLYFYLGIAKEQKLTEIKSIQIIGERVNVQAMVFGNIGDDCSTGVAFTRNPSTGEKSFFEVQLMHKVKML